MYETLIEYHKVLLKENLKAAPDKTYFMLKKVKFLGHIIEDKKVKLLTSRIDGFQKLEPPKSMKALQRYLGTINLLAKYVYGMQPILQPFYNLLHKETDFKRTQEHQKIFEQMKKTITQVRTNDARHYRTILHNNRCIEYRHWNSIATTTPS